MGGCRCSYYTCKATSDKQTHFFHYPVFDKVRCHEWLTNGQRLDLVDLTLSQLKNRVVCQHHFRDEMFMNNKKDKLTRSAVPTENGPYISRAIRPKSLKQEPVSIDDEFDEPVEVTDNRDTQYFTARERIATYPIQYKDFLKNIALDSLNDPDLLKSLPPCKRNKPNDNVKKPILKNSNRPNQQSLLRPRTLNKFDAAEKEKNVVILSEEKVSAPVAIKKIGNLQTVTPDFVIQPAKAQSVGVREPNQPQPENEYIISDLLPHVENLSENPYTLVPLSQQTFTMPLEKDRDKLPVYHLTECTPQLVEIESGPNEGERNPGHGVRVLNTKTNLPLQVQEIMNNSVTPKVISKQGRESLLAKSRMSPVKIAEIEKKRKFNMRLKDVIEEGLNKSDASESMKNLRITDNSLAKESAKSLQKSVVTKNPAGAPSIEQKGDTLNNCLLSKVDRNSREIAEIKKILLAHTSNKDLASVTSVTVKKTNRLCQTEWRELSNKNYLFEKVSQYLSPSVLNLVYEEMFLNKTRSCGSTTKTKKNYTKINSP